MALSEATLNHVAQALGSSYGNLYKPAILVQIRELFGAYPDEQVLQAVQACIRQCKYPPTPAEISAQISAQEAQERRAQQQTRLKEKYIESDQAAAKILENVSWRELVGGAAKKRTAIITRLRKTAGLNFERDRDCIAFRAVQLALYERPDLSTDEAEALFYKAS